MKPEQALQELFHHAAHSKQLCPADFPKLQELAQIIQAAFPKSEEEKDFKKLVELQKKK
jgi:hypothetical protein